MCGLMVMVVVEVVVVMVAFYICIGGREHLSELLHVQRYVWGEVPA